MKKETLDILSSIAPETDLRIMITEVGIHYTVWNRIKTSIWNFILPPHVRLSIKKS